VFGSTGSSVVVVVVAFVAVSAISNVVEFSFCLVVVRKQFLVLLITTFSACCLYSSLPFSVVAGARYYRHGARHMGAKNTIGENVVSSFPYSQSVQNC
jgi:hypothetical protein